MSAAPSRIPEALDKIAARLGVPVEAFSDPTAAADWRNAVEMALSPSGRDLATSYAAMPTRHRAALANVARALAQINRDAA